MPSIPVTAAADLPVLEELCRREPLFHRPEVANSRAGFDAMMDATFWEVGASGRCYSRAFVLDTLDARLRASDGKNSGAWETSDFYCRQLAPLHYLLTYTLVMDGRMTRRCTLWRQGAAGWQALYHQGTVVQEAA